MGLQLRRAQPEASRTRGDCCAGEPTNILRQATPKGVFLSITKQKGFRCDARFPGRGGDGARDLTSLTCSGRLPPTAWPPLRPPTPGRPQRRCQPHGTFSANRNGYFIFDILTKPFPSFIVLGVNLFVISLSHPLARAPKKRGGWRQRAARSGFTDLTRPALVITAKAPLGKAPLRPALAHSDTHRPKGGTPWIRY
jgi:hypothetical protein